MKTELLISIISIVGALIAISGTLIATKMANQGQLKKQLENSKREMKKKYYISFIDALSKKYFYFTKPDCIEKVEAEMNFNLEANKLALYASEEMVMFIEKLKSGSKGVDTSFNKFMELLRKDLCDNSFKPFSTQIETISLSYPYKVVIKDQSGNKTII